MNHETCPELYDCHRVKMTPLIRVLLRCTAAEAMESICATCEQEHGQGRQDSDYVAPSGRKVKVVVGDDAEQMAGASAGSS
jgi:biotin-(acetyl-CoA carboxylase) ligase